MAPRIVLMNDNGDIIFKRPLADNGQSNEVEHIDGSISASPPNGFKYEVNIKNYFYQTLENLYIQNYLSSRPNVMEDETKNSIQVWKLNMQKIPCLMGYYNRQWSYVKRVVL